VLRELSLILGGGAYFIDENDTRNNLSNTLVDVALNDLVDLSS